MSIKPKTCIFCGRAPLSKEHIWSEWTYKYVPRDPAARHVRTTIASTKYDPNITGIKTTQNYTGAVNSVKIKAVCGPHCNGGWMSGLETKVKPILIPLMMGHPAVLAKESQTTLAAWIAMKIMVCEFSDMEDVTSSPSEREFLMRTQMAPNSWSIWIGQVSSPNWASAYHRHSVTLGEIVNGEPQPPGGSYAKNTQAVTLGIGGLLVHVIASAIPNLGFKLPYQMDRQLIRIWPFNKGVFWPMGNIISDEDALGIANAMNRFTSKLKWRSIP